jgi:hypothetical protein
MRSFAGRMFCYGLATGRRGRNIATDLVEALMRLYVRNNRGDEVFLHGTQGRSDIDVAKTHPS